MDSIIKMIVKLIFDKDMFKTQNKQHNAWSIRTTKGMLVLRDGQVRCKTATTGMGQYGQQRCWHATMKSLVVSIAPN